MAKTDEMRDAELASAGFRLVSTTRQLVIVADLKSGAEYKIEPPYGILAWGEMIAALVAQRADPARFQGQIRANITQAIQTAADRH